MKDLKAALNSGIKPDISHVRTPLMVYTARACEYGNDKYQRANYARPAGTTADDFRRLRTYLRAAVGHIIATLDAMEMHQSLDPDLENAEGMKAAAYAPDLDATPGAKVGASCLPHVAHAAASMNMALTQATMYGLLPADPGQPWKSVPVAVDAEAERVYPYSVVPIDLDKLVAEVAAEFGPMLEGGFDPDCELCEGTGLITDVESNGLATHTDCGVCRD